MMFPDLTFVGPPIDDAGILERLPAGLRDLIQESNGFIALGGGFHVRGACRKPRWHSLREAWTGSGILDASYWNVLPTDIPFAEEVLGDQFLLRDSKVWRLEGETGEIKSTGSSLSEFMEAVRGDPIEYLGLEPLARFRSEGGTLAPGELLSSYPPFCTSESKDGVSLRAVPSEERIAFLGYLAAQLRLLPDGTRVEFKVTK